MIIINIYTITGIIDIDKKGTTGERCFGYFSNFDDAEHCVKENRGDIYEQLYKYAIIEKVEEGLHPYAIERWLYKYIDDMDEYTPIDVPKCLEHIVNFAIG